MTAMCTEVGNTSFDDCEALTWSFGCTGRAELRRVASVASTSFMFMFDEVPRAGLVDVDRELVVVARPR